MINLLTSYWLATVPVAITGLTLLRIMKNWRDQKDRMEKAVVPITVRRNHQG